MKKVILLVIPLLILYACAGGGNEKPGSDDPPPKSMIEDKTPQSIKEGKGIGEIKEVKLNDPLNNAMIKSGKAIYDLKCAACHKLTDQRVVGPGWDGVTSKRKPEWIMNMILNVDVMLDEDPTARALFEECLTRMPNQNLTQDDARAVLEFMLDNDSKG